MKQKKLLFIYGSGGHAKVILDILQKNHTDVDLILSNDSSITSFMGIKVSNNQIEPNINDKVFIAIGNNLIRKKVAESLIVKYINALHPSSQISNNVHLGNGIVMMANSSVNADSRIGDFVIINTNASVDHDCILENYVHLSPNVALAGNVYVGEGAHIGIGACVIPGIKIGKWSTIGAGSVIINNVPDFAVVVGNPAKILRFNKE